MRILQIFIVLLSILSFTSAQAEDVDTPKRYVKLRILPERADISPGEEIWIGIEQSIYPKWHTYWKNPGDSGSKPRIDWSMPDGFEVSEIQWPVPHKIPYPPLMNYGYEDSVILLQKLKAPPTIPKGPLKFSADIEILVCKEECIPEFDVLNITLNDPNSVSEDNSAYLNAAQTKLPISADWPATFKEVNGNFILSFPEFPDSIAMDDITFFPVDWGLVNNAEASALSYQDSALILTQKRGERPLSAIDNISSILGYASHDGHWQGIEFTASKAGGVVNNNQPMRTPEQTESTTIMGAIIFAIIGGLILNLMPCVFPVLSIKALSLVKIADKHPELARLHGLSYTAGVVLSFVVIAGILIALQAGGATIGWGFQLQNPLVVALLAYLLFIIGLNLSGFFEFSGRFTNVGGKLAQGNGISNSFFTGILATLVATPCTAPFMATAIGFALTQPPFASLSIFAALGFGLALPYLALSFAPFLQHLLPKPGAWMETFKELLAFPMYISTAWLVWVISHQTASINVLWLLIGMILIAFGIWLFKHQPKSKKKQVKIKLIALLAFIAALALLPPSDATQEKQHAKQAGFSSAYNADKLDTLLSGDAPIFVEMTAAWCITCKVNHAVAINKDSTKKLFADKNVQYLIGDWTNQNPEITKYLKSYGRNGVPIYVYYGPRNEKTKERPEAIVLPQVLTPAIVADYVQ